MESDTTVLWIALGLSLLLCAIAGGVCAVLFKRRGRNPALGFLMGAGLTFVGGLLGGAAAVVIAIVAIKPPYPNAPPGWNSKWGPPPNYFPAWYNPYWGPPAATPSHLPVGTVITSGAYPGQGAYSGQGGYPGRPAYQVPSPYPGTLGSWEVPPQLSPSALGAQGFGWGASGPRPQIAAPDLTPADSSAGAQSGSLYAPAAVPPAAPPAASPAAAPPAASPAAAPPPERPHSS